MLSRDRGLHRWIGLAIVVTVGLGVAGCSSGDDAAPDTTTTTSATTVPATTAPSTTTTTTTPPAPRALGTIPPGGDGPAGDLTDITDTTDTAGATDDGPTALGDLAPGDCVELSDLEAAGDLEVTGVAVLDCTDPHDAEVYALISLDDDPDSRHPGDEHVLAAADRVCLDAFEGYVGARYVDTRLEIVHLRPTVASWARGDRRVICAVVNAGAGPLVGSVAGAGAGAP